MATFFSFLSQAGSSAPFIACVTAAFGGFVAYFKPFLLNEEDIGKRLKLKREALLEGVAKSYHRMLNAAVSISDLRGKPPSNPDTIGDHVTEMFRIFSVVQTFAVIEASVHSCFTALMASGAVGVVGLVVAIIWDDARPWVVLVCLIVMVLQVAIAFRLRSVEQRIKDYEKTT